jgi:KAP family P-loop domain/HEAT repeats/Clp amino terminal domain, pathogenicity island component
MEGSLLYYLAARISVHPMQDWAMATLVSPWMAVTTAHAVPRGPQSDEGKHVFWLDCPHIEERHDVRVSVEAEDRDVGFAVLKLEKPLELPTAELVFSAEPVQEGALWETLCIVPSVDEAIPVHGRVEGIEIVGERSLIKLSVNESPLDFRRVSGAPVMVDGKVIGIVWGIKTSEPNESSKKRRGVWYAMPISAMIESKSTDAIRKLLYQNQGSRLDGPATGVDPGAPSASVGYDNSEIMVRLQDANSDVRAAAVHALRAQVSSVPEIRAALMKLLADENSDVRAAAIGALSEMVSRDAEVSDAVAKLLDDKNSSVRAAVVKVFTGMASDQNIRAALTARLKDENSSVRAAAVAALRVADTDTGVTGDPARAAEVEAEATGDATPRPEDGETRTDIAQPSSVTPELEPELFGRLSASSRRALSHAAGMRRYLTAQLSAEISQKIGLQQHENEQLEHTPQSIPLAYLIAGLFENEDGPTRRLFLNQNIDAVKIAAFIQQAEGLPLPSRTAYSPIKLEKLPWLTPPTQLALQVARDFAESKGAAQIQSRHLLYGVLSIKDNSLVKLLAEAGVRQEDVPLSETGTIPTPVPKSIAFVNADTSVGEDLLGFEADVNALSAIIAAKATETPLSIGLFGDWGSGKSFFMGKLENCIRDLAMIERRTNGNSAYCSNIVPIWFNAWSYVETDLWASLVTDIFEELARAIERDQELARGASPATAKARLLAAMASARDVVAEEVRRRDAAKAELEAVEEHVANLKVTDEELEKKLGSTELLKDAYRAVAKDPSVKAQIDDAAKRLSIPEAGRAAGEMRASLLEIKGIWSAMGFALKGWKSTRAWLLAAGVLLAVFVFLWVLLPWALKVNLNSKIAGAAGLLLSAVAWLAPFFKKARAGLAIISRIKQQQQQRIHEERNKIEEASKKLQEGVRQKLSEAEARVDTTKAEIGRLEQTLTELRADKQLLDFIRERSLSDDYTSRLGTVAKARKDFKQLSDLMDRVRNERQDGPAAGADGQNVAFLLPRIDRIVLYIDDLDRCAEDRVVKVLEAVHLLLAFRLFVVIVAVDSRWLLRSLRRHSSAFQTSDGGGTGISDEELAHWESTPLNYLEKIFQIPFYLRPMRQGGFARLVDSIVGAVASDREERRNAEKKPGDPMRVDDSLQPTIPADEVVKDAATQQTTARDAKAETGIIPLAEATSGTGAGEISRAMGAASSNSDTIEQVAQIPGSEHHSHTAQPPSIEEANPAALQLHEWERDFMKKLHPLITSPRSAKRFVNIYRLMGVSIIDQNELTAFVGDKNGGQHRAALLLLAILTGYPAEATDILRDLLEKERPETWWQYINELERTWDKEHNDRKREGKPSTGSESVSDRRRRDLMAKLRLLRGEIPETQSCDQFVKWASKVAKYSFESGRVLMLLDDEVKAD